MEKPVFCRVLARLAIATAIAMIIFALSAEFLGVDSDQKWGPFRKMILALGLTGLVIPLLSRVVDAVDRRLLRSHWPYVLRSRLTRITSYFSTRLRRSRLAPGVEAEPTISGSLSQPRGNFEDEPIQRINVALRLVSSTFSATKGWIAIALIFAAVELLYIELVGVGHLTEWPRTSDYYGMLADSFIHSRTDLFIEPSPLLAELKNPYSPPERFGIPVLWDCSYFRSKYYMYWGPAPAALAALWKLGTGRSVGDQHIVFIAVSSIFIFSTLIILYLRSKYYPSLPGWLLAASVVIVATAHPMLWILNRPHIYQAAIASGQGFLMAGLYFALPVMNRSHMKPWRLALVGVLWSLALGSRLILLGAVAVLAIAAAIQLFSRVDSQWQWKDVAAKVGALALPLSLGIGLLGLYNYIRFDNFLEPGIRYALTTRDLNLLMEEGLLFNIGYLLPNLISYLITPIQFGSVFPFIGIQRGISSVSTLLGRFDIPGEYYRRTTSGLLFAMPTIVLSGFLVMELLCCQTLSERNGKVMSDTKSDRNRDQDFRRILVFILLSGILAAAPAFLYTVGDTRFLLDTVPLFAVTCVVGAWRLYYSSRNYPVRRSLAILFILSTVIAAALVGLLLAIHGSRFDDLNPVLYNSLIEMFSW